MIIKNIIRSLTNRYLIGGQYDDRIRNFFKLALDNVIRQINNGSLQVKITEYMKEYNEIPPKLNKINPDITENMQLPGLYLISQEYQSQKDEDVILKIGMGKDVLSRIDEYGTLAYDGVFLYGIVFDIGDEPIEDKNKRVIEYEKNFHRVFKSTKKRIKSNTYTRLLNNIPGLHFGEWFRLSIERFVDEITDSLRMKRFFNNYVYIIFDKPIRFANFIKPENIQYPASIYYNGYQLTRETLSL